MYHPNNITVKHNSNSVLTDVLKIVFLLSVTFSLISCGKADNSKDNVDIAKIKSPVTEKANIDLQIAPNKQAHPGKKLAETKCFFCHSPDAPEHGHIAPPMVAVKAHYIEQYTSKVDFIQALQNFVEQPEIEMSLMPGAIRKYGLMPTRKFDAEDIALIGEYLYDSQIEEPKWFKQHWQERQGNRTYNSIGLTAKESNSAKSPADIGLEYALATKKELGRHLMGTIKSKGTIEAVLFCNESAYPLTQSKADEFHADIRRVSDKPRNANNQASTEELQYVEHFKQSLVNGESAEPIVVTKDNRHHVYYPIVTNSMCLQCHGDKQSIKSDVLNVLQRLYPDDKATGYTEEQVRGIWSVSFEKQVNKREPLE